MTDDQYRDLKLLILEQNMKIEELRLMLRRQEEMADQRFAMLFEWLAPQGYQDAINKLDSITEIEIPDDLKKFFGG